MVPEKNDKDVQTQLNTFFVPYHMAQYCQCRSHTRTVQRVRATSPRSALAAGIVVKFHVEYRVSTPFTGFLTKRAIVIRDDSLF